MSGEQITTTAVVTHSDTGMSREVYAGNNMRGSEGKTMCGLWLPMWTDGPNGKANAARWNYDNPTCPVCAAKIAEDDDDA